MGFLDEWTVKYRAYYYSPDGPTVISETNGYIEEEEEYQAMKVNPFHQTGYYNVNTELTASHAVDISEEDDFDLSWTLTPLHTLWQGYYYIRTFYLVLSNFDWTVYLENAPSPPPVENPAGVIIGFNYDHIHGRAYWSSTLTEEEVPLPSPGDIPITYLIRLSRTNGVLTYQGIGESFVVPGNPRYIPIFPIVSIAIGYEGTIMPEVALDPDVETETVARFAISGSIFTPPPPPQLLPRVPQPRWDGYKLMWEEVPDARSYAIKLYKNGIGSENLADFRIVPAGQKFFDYSALYDPDTGLFTAGKYRATVQALPTLPPEGGG